MSVREYAVLYLGSTKAPGGAAVIGGGNAVITSGQHALDGSEHRDASDSTRLDATASHHGLLPKLSGDPADALLGDGTWGAPTPALALDDLTDVAISSPLTADRIRFDGSTWVNSRQVHRPVMVEDPGSGLWYVLVTGDGDAVLTEA